MSSLVTEALASAGSLAKDDWSTKIDKLSSRAFDIKHELNDFIQQCYDEFVPMLSTSDQLHSKLKQLITDVENLQRSFGGMVKNQIRDSTKEFEQLSLEHAQTTQLVTVLENIFLIHSFLEGYKENLKTQNIYQAALSLNEMEKVLKSIEDCNIIESNIYQALKMEFILCQENLRYTLDETWRDSILWELPTDDEEEQFRSQLCISFSNHFDGVSGQDVVYSLAICNSLLHKMNKIAKNFLEYFVRPLVIDKSIYPSISSDKEKCVLALEKRRLETTTSHIEQESPPTIVFAKVKDSLQFLFDGLLKLQLTPSEVGNNISHENKRENLLMSIFCPMVFEDVMKLLIDQCLRKAIPSTKEELANYEEVVLAVKDFESFLKSIQFLPPSVSQQGGLMGFVTDIHVHFANQRCIAVLAKARNLMKMDIYETVEINDEENYKTVEENILQNLTYVDKKVDPRDLLMEAATRIVTPSTPLHDNTMCLPRFCVSKGAKELLDLAYETMNEATTSSPECATRLFLTTQHIFELFAAIVPMYHRDSLKNLPQAAALHHNDCWYIAHYLLTLGHQFSKRLPGKPGDIELTFVHQAPMLRQLGSECFLAQMRMQRDQLLECLNPLNEFGSLSNTDKYMIAERPIKQVMHQLHHLRKVWFGVLPSNILRSTLATLVNSVISQVISSICTMEEISSVDSIQLKTVCCLLQDQVPSLFLSTRNSDDVNSNDIGKSDLTWQRDVKKWQRLSELIFVLGASLRDIVDRWAESKGPLAAAFTVVEVKGLIRALFQNTDRRANALSKIRYEG